MSIIAPDDVLGMTAILFVLAWLGFLVDGSRFGRAVPGVVVILCAGLALSNLGIAPFESTAGGFIGRHVVAAAIPLLMIKADFTDLPSGMIPAMHRPPLPKPKSK